MEFYRPTYAEISLQALADNLAAVRSRIPAHVGVLAMVKADAYGHGAVPVAKRLGAAGVAAFGVATVEEGSELRAAGITQPILVMGGLMGQGDRVAEQMVAERLTPIVHTRDGVAPLERAASRRGVPLAVHAKIDTGMSRLGARPEHFATMIAAIRAAPHLRLEGVMTHLAAAADAAYAQQQLAAFQQAQADLGPRFPGCCWHAANSEAIIRRLPHAIPPAGRAWVRPGLMLYGAVPSPEDRATCALRGIMSLKSQVILCKQLPTGTKVSYHCTWTARRPSRIAVVPIGYADGYPWSLSNQGEVLIGGQRCPIAGRVTMDFLTVDVTEARGPVAPGDEVVLLGRQGDVVITAEEVAGWAGTIPYEIFCRISKRMPRVYV